VKLFIGKIIAESIKGKTGKINYNSR